MKCCGFRNSYQFVSFDHTLVTQATPRELIVQDFPAVHPLSVIIHPTLKNLARANRLPANKVEEACQSLLTLSLVSTPASLKLAVAESMLPLMPRGLEVYPILSHGTFLDDKQDGMTRCSLKDFISSRLGYSLRHHAALSRLLAAIESNNNLDACTGNYGTTAV